MDVGAMWERCGSDVQGFGSEVEGCVRVWKRGLRMWEGVRAM